VLATFGKPVYYAQRILHVSVCRWPGRVVDAVTHAPVDWPQGVPTSCRATRVLGRAGHVEFEIRLFDGSSGSILVAEGNVAHGETRQGVA